MSKSPKKFSAVAAVAGLLATLFVAQASPASAETGNNFAKRSAEYSMDRSFSGNTVTVYAGESISIYLSASLSSTARNALANGDVLSVIPGITKTGTFMSFNVYTDISTSAGNGTANGESNTATATVTGAPAYTNFNVSINAYASAESTITFNPTIKKGATAYDPNADFVEYEKTAQRANHGYGSNTVVAKTPDTSLTYMLPGVCVSTSGLTAGDTLTLATSASDGTTTVGTVDANWGASAPGDMPYDYDQGLTYTVPSYTAGDLISVKASILVSSVTANKTYSVSDFKVTKNGTELPIVGCDETTATIAATANSTTVTVTLGTSTDVRTMGGISSAKYMGYSCALYASTDTNHTTPIAYGFGNAMGMNATSVTCMVFNVPAGTYSIGIRGKSWAITSSEKFSTSNVTVAGLTKVDPTFPTVGTKVTKGKTIKVALSSTLGTASQGKNSQGLVTVVAPASAGAKAYCTVAAVKTSGKITGYTIKGVKKHASNCKVKITITGNTQYNTKSKTVTVKVV